jgi:hypothetical protein
MIHFVMEQGLMFCNCFSGWADLSSPTVSGVSSSEQVTPDSEAAADLLSPCTPSMEEEASSSIASSAKQMNVGHRAELMQYAMQEWQGHTRRAETILKVQL